jgi:hypothetical protein
VGMKNEATTTQKTTVAGCYCSSLSTVSQDRPGSRCDFCTGLRRTYYCLACSREMGVMTRAAYEAAGEECGECVPVELGD